MRPSLQLRVSQHLALTPQLQQSIRLLQLSTAELNDEIAQALQNNPLLELDDAPGAPISLETGGQALPWESASGAGIEADSSLSEDSPPAQGMADEAWSDEAHPWPIDDTSGHSGPTRSTDDDLEDHVRQTCADGIGLSEHLQVQLALTQLSDRERLLACVITEALDDDGYFTQSLDDLARMLMTMDPGHHHPHDEDNSLDLLSEELRIALRHVQSLDPPGIAARTPAECLRLQLQVLPDTPVRALALTLVDSHLNQWAQRDFAGLKKNLACSDEALRAAQTMILNLDPHPGARYTQSDTRYITPDTVVSRHQGRWVAQLNAETLPRLRINRFYADVLRASRTDKGSHMAGQLQEARWLIKNVKQRFETILRVTQAIVDRQQAFFEQGDKGMRPLVLRDIADPLGLHESTVSRATTQKYLACPQGTFELKFFFGSHVSTDAGASASSTAIRALIKQLISTEDRHKPLSDTQITRALVAQGLHVARRTVAKYRELLNIPPVHQRKTL